MSGPCRHEGAQDQERRADHTSTAKIAQERLRSVVSAGQQSIPPIPDPKHAAALWAAGRTMSTQQAVTEALSEEAWPPIV